MLRRSIIIGLLAAVGLAACDSAQSGSTTSPPTDAEVTTPAVDSAVDDSTVDGAAETTVTSADVSETTLAEADDQLPAGYAELPQYGFQFIVPEPLVATPTDDYDFRAVSTNPKGLLTVLDCGDCTLDGEPEADEVFTSDEIDGVPVLIVENANLDMPDGVASNELIVADDQRNFSIIMSVEGDIGPVWDEFVDSIRFVDPDPEAAASTPTETSAPQDGPITIEEAGLTFTFPDGFITDGVADEDGGYSAARTSDFALAIVFPCPTCTRTQITEGGSFEDIDIDGKPTVVTKVDGPEGPTYIALILAAKGQKIIATMVGEDVDDSWQELLDSIKIEGD